jgi:hypothetical protein
MLAPTFDLSAFLTFIYNVLAVFADLLMFCRLCFRSSATVSAENSFLRRQLGLYVERKGEASRASAAIRFTLARLSRLFDWRKPVVYKYSNYWKSLPVSDWAHPAISG